jgi:purine-binding chemotaxis protein CheW
VGKYIVFRIHGEEFGIELGRVFEIINPQKAIPCPGTPAYIKGIFNLRGTVIPLMDLRQRLGVSPSTEKEKIVVAFMHDEKVGLLVDAIEEITNIDEEQIASPPSIFKGLKPEYLLGVGKLSDRLIIILNMDAMMTIEEIKFLGDISEVSLADEEDDNDAG